MTKGESAIEVDGKPYTLAFNVTAFLAFEDETKTSIFDAVQGDKINLQKVSCLLWAALQKHHAMTREESNELMDQAGMIAIGTAVSDGLGSYFGADKAAAAVDQVKGKKAKAKPVPARG